MTQAQTATPNARVVPPELRGVEDLHLPIKVYESHVEVPLSDGTTKSVSLNDFHAALSRLINVEEQGITILPPTNCYSITRTTNKLFVGCYYPGRIRNVKFVANRDTGKMVDMAIPFPNIIISHVLDRRNGKYYWEKSNYYATAKNPSQVPLEPIKEANPEQHIWALPLSNIYGDGRMCYGGNSLTREFTDNLRGLDWHFALLYNSPYNSDLSIPSLGRNHGMTPLSWFTMLSKLKTFPYEKLTFGDTIPKATVNSIASQIMGVEEVVAPETPATTPRARATRATTNENPAF